MNPETKRISPEVTMAHIEHRRLAKGEANRISACLREQILCEAIGNRACLPSSRIGRESVGAYPTKNREVINVAAMIVGGEGQQGAHVSLERKVGSVGDGDSCARLHTSADQGRVDPVLEVIGVGEVIEPILDVGFGERRHCKQCHHN